MKYFLLSVLGLFVFLPSSQAQSTVSGFNPGSITIESQGSEGTIRMGSTAPLARFRLSNRTGQNLQLESLRLRNYGTARLSESFENLVITNNGQIVGRAVNVDRQYANFRFENLLVGRGDSLSLAVEGRLIYARTGRTVRLGIQYEEDVKAVLPSSPYFGVPCEDCRGTRFKTQRLRPGAVTINRGNFRTASRFRGSRRSSYSTSSADRARYYRTPVSNRTYSQGSKGITFFSSYLNSKSDFRVEGVFLAIGSGSQVSDKNSNGVPNELADFDDTFSNFTLYVNGRQEGSTSGFEVYRGQTGLLFDDTIDVPGNAQLLVSGRITNSAVNGDKVKFSLGRDGLIDPVYLHSGQSVNLGNINGGTTGNFSQSGGSEPLNISK